MDYRKTKARRAEDNNNNKKKKLTQAEDIWVPQCQSWPRERKKQDAWNLNTQTTAGMHILSILMQGR